MDILKIPEFIANQILTHDQLNLLKQYLEQQDRLSRIRLTGTGIVCGLEVDTSTDGEVTISSGFGVTSGGYILEFPGTTLKKFRPYQDFGQLEDNEQPYVAWQKKSILELIPDSGSGSTITPQSLNNRILVLYLEKQEVQLDSCMVTDCNSKGKNIHVHVRALLVAENDIDAIPDCTPVNDHLLKVPRLHTLEALEDIQDAEQLNQNYQKLILQFVDEPAHEETLKKAFERFSPLISMNQDLQLSVLYEELKNHFNTAGINQYHYDLLKDFVDSYNEFVKAACQIEQACQAAGDFPRHLMLGALDGTTGYRNAFIASAAHTLSHGDKGRLQRLYQRLAMIATTVNLEKQERIGITPSHTTLYPLGKRAVPFYFNEKIFPFWQPDPCCTDDDIWSYHDPDDEKESLNTDYGRCSLLRIEGHLGHPLDEATEFIEATRRRNNLEFDLSFLCCEKKNDDDPHNFSGFARKIAGLEHTGGVEKGGTFILVTDEDKQVVADFSLTGQVPCCLEVQPILNGDIRGRVIDETGKVYPSAGVLLSRIDNPDFKAETKTNSDGNYQFPDIPAGGYSLTVRVVFDDGTTKERQQNTQVSGGQTVQVNFVIPRDDTSVTGDIKGIVITENREPVPKATVSLNPGNQTQKSGRNGSFSFTGLQPDTYTLVATFSFATGAARIKIKSDPVTVVLAGGGTAEATLILKQDQRNASLTVSVLTLTRPSKPLTTAKVTIRLKNDRTAQPQSLNKANSNKSYLFKGLKKGIYTVTASANGFVTATEKNVTISAGEKHKETLRLKPLNEGTVLALPEKLVLQVSRKLNVSQAQAKKALLQTYSSRHQQHRDALASVPAAVKTSKSWKLGNTLVNTLIPAETNSNNLNDEFAQFIKQVVAKATGRVTPANKKHYASLMQTTSAAMLDAISRTHFANLDTDSVNLVKALEQQFRKVGIAPAKFLELWQGDELVNNLKLASAERIIGLLG